MIPLSVIDPSNTNIIEVPEERGHHTLQLAHPKDED